MNLQVNQSNHNHNHNYMVGLLCENTNILTY